MAAAELPAGFRLAAASSGLAKGERLDLVLAVADEAYPAAAMFTRNQVVASPVAMSREHLRQTGGRVRAILVNAGCANACTGAQGDEDAATCAQWVAELVGCEPVEVLAFSTGVIGKRLDVGKIERTLPGLATALASDAFAVERMARAIMTTDLVPKVSQHEFPAAGGGKGRVLGLAKGSGMIHPDLATMLAFLFSDMDTGTSPDLMLRAAVGDSFHRISVDGDTSTNDSVLLWCSGKQRAEHAAFLAALQGVTLDLAKAVARDGEGATKLIEVKVSGARTPGEALACARTIALSPLVRTAVHGHDANWGRIVAAAGRSGVEIDTRRMRAGIGPACLFEDDAPHPENEPQAKAHLMGKDVVLWVDLASGTGENSFFSCDLTADYIRINADYRS